VGTIAVAAVVRLRRKERNPMAWKLSWSSRNRSSGPWNTISLVRLVSFLTTTTQIRDYHKQSYIEIKIEIGEQHSNQHCREAYTYTITNHLFAENPLQDRGQEKRREYERGIRGSVTQQGDNDKEEEEQGPWEYRVVAGFVMVTHKEKIILFLK